MNTYLKAGFAALFLVGSVCVAQEPTFTMLCAGDLQYASAGNDHNQLNDMVTYASANRTSMNIEALCTSGDNVDTSNTTQWSAYTTNFFNPIVALSPAMPLIDPIGNHDYEGATTGGTPVPSNRVTTQYTANIESVLATQPYFGGVWTPGGGIQDPEVNYWIYWMNGTRQWIAISLEFCPRTTTSPSLISWMVGIVASHPTSEIILITHDAGDPATNALSTSGASGTSGCSLNNVDGVNDPTAAGGLDLWNAIKSYPNIAFIYGGHFVGSLYTDTFTVVGTNGNMVPVFYFNHQANSNYVWWRNLQINPSTGAINFSTYNAYLGESLTDSTNQNTAYYTPLGNPILSGIIKESGAIKAIGNMVVNQ